MSKRVILVRHGNDPADDRAFAWLSRNGFVPEILRPFAGDALPQDMAGIAGSVIYGGRYPVSETDRYPFLLEEAAWIGRCIAADLPLLGICQGAQLIAHHLGAEVGPSPGGWHEFGSYEVAPTPAGREFMPEPVHMMQMHHHTFAIPEGAEHLASSALFPNQAFRVGPRLYGVQFHPELTPEIFRRWQEAPWAAYGKPGAQTRALQDELIARHDSEQAAWFDAFLARLFAPAAGGVG